MRLINLKNFDWVLFGMVTMFTVISLVTLYSLNTNLFFRQALWFVIAFFAIFFVSQINIAWLITQKWFRYGLYWFSFILLLVPIIQGESAGGAERWIMFGSFQFGPAELMKVALIFVLASFFSRRHVAAWNIKNIAISIFYAGLPALVIILQPDLGSALVILGIWLGFLLLGGVNKKRFFIGVLVFLLMACIAWFFVLHDYQKNRVIGFLSPDSDPLGINYNIIQSKIAIGSAGFFGKGFQSGTQTQLGYLPEAHTDFIFAAFTEEWGLLGASILLLTYLFFLFRIITIGLKVRRNDLRFLVFGAGLVFFLHFLMNIGSSIGMTPVVGISLPFISYGGSNLLTSSLLIGIIERVKIESIY